MYSEMERIREEVNIAQFQATIPTNTYWKGLRKIHENVSQDSYS